jgi:hypothetical protein
MNLFSTRSSRPVPVRSGVSVPSGVKPTCPLSVVASSKPMLTGVGSTFNLAGIYFDNEPIVGFLKPGSTSFEEAMEISADCLDQAERILCRAEDMMGVETFTAKKAQRGKGPKVLRPRDS